MIPEIFVHFKQTGASHADAGEKASDFFLGFLRLMTGYKTVRVQDGNVTSETDVKAWKVFGGIIATIICLPVAIPMTLIGLIPYAVSSSHSTAYSIFKNSRNLPPPGPQPVEQTSELSDDEKKAECETKLLVLLQKSYPDIESLDDDVSISHQITDLTDDDDDWKFLYPFEQLYFKHWVSKDGEVIVQVFDVIAIGKYWNQERVLNEGAPSEKKISNDGFNPYTREPFNEVDVQAIRKQIQSLANSSKVKKSATFANTQDMDELRKQLDKAKKDSSSSSDEK